MELGDTINIDSYLMYGDMVSPEQREAFADEMRAAHEAFEVERGRDRFQRGMTTSEVKALTTPGQRLWGGVVGAAEIALPVGLMSEGQVQKARNWIAVRRSMGVGALGYVGAGAVSAGMTAGTGALSVMLGNPGPVIAIATVFAGQQFEDTLEETGDMRAAIGAAVFSQAIELAGFNFTVRMSRTAARRLASQAFANKPRDAMETVRAVLANADDIFVSTGKRAALVAKLTLNEAKVNAIEEFLQVLGTQASTYAFTDQDFVQTVRNTLERGLPQAASGAVVGGIVGGGLQYGTARARTTAIMNKAIEESGYTPEAVAKAMGQVTAVQQMDIQGDDNNIYVPDPNAPTGKEGDQVEGDQVEGDQVEGDQAKGDQGELVLDGMIESLTPSSRERVEQELGDVIDQIDSGDDSVVEDGTDQQERDNAQTDLEYIRDRLREVNQEGLIDLEQEAQAQPETGDEQAAKPTAPQQVDKPDIEQVASFLNQVGVNAQVTADGRLAFPTSAKVNITERELLRLRLRMQALGARKAAADTRRKEQEVTRRKLRELKEKVKEKKVLVEKLRGTYRDIVNDSGLDRTTKLQLLDNNKMREMTTQKKMFKGILELRQRLQKQYDKEAVDRFTKALDAAKSVHPNFKKRVKDIVQQFSRASVSNDKRVALQSLLDFIERSTGFVITGPESAEQVAGQQRVVPEEVAMELQRLFQTEISDLDADTATVLAEEVELINMQSRLLSALSNKRQSESVRRRIQQAQREVGSTLLPRRAKRVVADLTKIVSSTEGLSDRLRSGVIAFARKISQNGFGLGDEARLNDLVARVRRELAAPAEAALVAPTAEPAPQADIGTLYGRFTASLDEASTKDIKNKPGKRTIDGVDFRIEMGDDAVALMHVSTPPELREHGRTYAALKKFLAVADSAGIAVQADIRSLSLRPRQGQKLPFGFVKTGEVIDGNPVIRREPSVTQPPAAPAEAAPVEPVVQEEAESVASRIDTDIRSLDTQYKRRLDPNTGKLRQGFLENTIIDKIMTLSGRVGNFLPSGMAEWIGGGRKTMMYQLGYERLRTAQSQQHSDTRDDMEFINDALREHGLDEAWLRENSEMMAGKIGRIRAIMGGDPASATESMATFKDYKLSNGQRVKMPKARAMGLVALMRDRERFDRVVFDQTPVVLPVSGRFPTPFVLSAEDIDMFTGSLTKSETAVVDAVVGRINGSIKDRLAKWWERTHGEELPHKDAIHMPSHIHLIKGGDAALKVENRNLHQQAAESSGLLKERIDPGEQAIIIPDLLVEYGQYTHPIKGTIALSEPLRDLQQFLEDPGTKEILKNVKHGNAILRRMQQTADAGARSIVGGPSLNGPMSDFITQLTNNLTRGLLGLNPRVIMYQSVSVAQLTVDLPKEAVMQAVIEGAMVDSSVDERMFGNSGYMWNRNLGTSLNMINEASSTGQSIYGVQPKGEWAMSGIRGFDKGVMRIAWRAAEIVHGDNIDQVRDMTERAVQQTQPTNDWLHASGIAMESQVTPALRLFSMFRAQRAKNMNIAFTRVLRIARGEGAVRNVRDMGISLILQTMGIVAIRELWEMLFEIAGTGMQGELPDFDAETAASEWAEGLWQTLAGNAVFGEFFGFFGQKMVSPTSNMFVPEASPVIGIMQDLLIGLSRVRSNMDTDSEQFWDGLLDVINAGGSISGFPMVVTPLREVRKMYEATRDSSESKMLISPRGSSSKDSYESKMLISP